MPRDEPTAKANPTRPPVPEHIVLAIDVLLRETIPGMADMFELPRTADLLRAIPPIRDEAALRASGAALTRALEYGHSRSDPDRRPSGHHDSGGEYAIGLRLRRYAFSHLGSPALELVDYPPRDDEQLGFIVDRLLRSLGRAAWYLKRSDMRYDRVAAESLTTAVLHRGHALPQPALPSLTHPSLMRRTLHHGVG